MKQGSRQLQKGCTKTYVPKKRAREKRKQKCLLLVQMCYGNWHYKELIIDAFIQHALICSTNTLQWATLSCWFSCGERRAYTSCLSRVLLVISVGLMVCYFLRHTVTIHHFSGDSRLIHGELWWQVLEAWRTLVCCRELRVPLRPP